jgi:hypothetical protein
MAFNTDLAVRIATVLDNTGLKKAEKALNKFEKQTQKLGKGLGLALGTTAVVAFGRAAVKAFAQDEAAAQRLTTAIDNLGLSLSATQAADYISNLEKTAGVADEVLRPALQALLTTTGSLTKSQQLLSNAIQISRASGIDLATVSQDLANGYVGITKGLKKYNTGLTQAELKSKSFSDVLGILLKNSAGAADAYLGTTAYKMDVLSVAADNAKESIGSGLVDALAKAGGGTSVTDAAKAFDTIAKSINGISNAIGTTIGFFTKLYKAFDNFTYNFDPILGNSRATNDLLAKGGSARQSTTGGAMARQKQQQVAEAAAAKRAKELAKSSAAQVKAQKALTAEQKKQALSKKQSALFDMEQIQIIAALKGNISKEDKLRLELQLALLTGNTTEADKLSKQLAMAIDSTGNLAKYLTTLPDANNPFKSWDAFLDSVLAKAKLAAQITSASTGIPVTSMGLSGSESIPHGNTPVTPISSISSGGTAVGFNSAGQITVNVSGSVVSEQDLVEGILLGIQKRSLSGSPSSIGRLYGMFD